MADGVIAIDRHLRIRGIDIIDKAGCICCPGGWKSRMDRVIGAVTKALWARVTRTGSIASSIAWKGVCRPGSAGFFDGCANPHPGGYASRWELCSSSRGYSASCPSSGYGCCRSASCCLLRMCRSCGARCCRYWSGSSARGFDGRDRVAGTGGNARIEESPHSSWMSRSPEAGRVSGRISRSRADDLVALSVSSPAPLAG